MNDFDWIGLVVVLFFLLFPLISTFLKKKKPVKKRPSPRPFHSSFPDQPKKQIIKPPQVVPLKRQTKPKRPPPKKLMTKYGSMKNGIILSEILKRPYWD